jgi:hypothetical protein
VRDTGRENARLSGSGAGEDQHGTVEGFHCLALLWVEVAKVRHWPRAKRACGDAACDRLRAQWSRVVTLGFGHLSVKGSNAAGMILSTSKMASTGANFEARPALVGLSLPI